MGELITLPRVAPQQSPAGTYGFEPPTERPRIDITACMDGYRVWVGAVPYKDFATLSNASRCASALMTLDTLDAWPVAPITPPEAA